MVELFLLGSLALIVFAVIAGVLALVGLTLRALLWLVLLPLKLVFGLILLPLLSGLLFIAGIIAGLYFYRWERTRPLSIIVWVSSALSTLLFLMAVLFLATTPI